MCGRLADAVVVGDVDDRHGAVPVPCCQSLDPGLDVANEQGLDVGLARYGHGN